jgi:hypothetical protein
VYGANPLEKYLSLVETPMDSSSESEIDDVPKTNEKPKQKRPVPVKALEALAKAREMKAKKKAEEEDAKRMSKVKREEAVKLVDESKAAIKNTVVPPPAAAPVSNDALRALEEKLQYITLKMNESPKKKSKKKVIIEESDTSSEEEVIIKRKLKKTAPAPVEDPAISAFRDFQARQVVEKENADKSKAEKDRLKSLFSRN